MDYTAAKGQGSSAYGLYIDIQDVREITDVEKSEAEHKAQVIVRIGEASKEFTLARFRELLGFESPGEAEMMSLYEIRDGYLDKAFVRVYAWAASEEQALCLAEAKYREANRSTWPLTAKRLFSQTNLPFSTIPSEDGSFLRFSRQVLPCPFCGGSNLCIRHTSERDVHPPLAVCCNDCSTEGPAKQTDDEAKEAWNKRVTEQS